MDSAQRPLIASWESSGHDALADTYDLSKSLHMATLFLSYSHADEALRDELAKHLSTLRREGLIRTWYDREMLPGSHIDAEISRNLEEADIALMLVSADFLNSDYCSSIELKRA